MLNKKKNTRHKNACCQKNSLKYTSHSKFYNIQQQNHKYFNWICLINDNLWQISVRNPSKTHPEEDIININIFEVISIEMYLNFIQILWCRLALVVDRWWIYFSTSFKFTFFYYIIAIIAFILRITFYYYYYYYYFI